MTARHRFILNVEHGSDGILALRAATSLLRDGHKECIYAYEDGTHVYASLTKTGVSAREWKEKQ